MATTVTPAKSHNINLCPDDNQPKNYQGQVLMDGATSAGRIKAGDFSIQDFDYSIGKGLDLITRGFHLSPAQLCHSQSLTASLKKYTGHDIDTNQLTNRERNACLSALVRHVWASQGWMEGYICLTEAAPEIGLIPRLITDAKKGAILYSQAQKGDRRRPVIDVRVSVVSADNNDTLECIGPKTAGGKAWKQHAEFAEVLKRPRWNSPGFTKGISPCISLGWLGILVGPVLPQDTGIATSFLTLNFVDYELDRVKANHPGFQYALDLAVHHACTPSTELQSCGVVAMLSYDLQVYARLIQQGWADNHGGSFILGAKQFTPSEWVACMVADCAALSPFQHQPNEFATSRLGMMAAMVQYGLYDVVYDYCCSNRLTSVQYLESIGVAQYGINAAFATGYIEAMGRSLLDRLNSGWNYRINFGFTAAINTCPFNAFNTRYRSWERTVKYMRQLRKSQAAEAKGLLDLVHADLVLKDCDLTLDADDAWARTLSYDADSLQPRVTIKYFIQSKTTELFSTPGVPFPDLCKNCLKAFKEVMESEKLEEVHAFPGLPDIVTNDRSAGLAVGIRRACHWAISDDCCTVCACRVAAWADRVSYLVLSARSYDEATTDENVWLLQSCFVGAITYWPIQMPFLVSCFDLLADLSYERGAMGLRDTVDI